ncbi:hypothetical protein, partial [Phocaeicola sp.]|uniref:hypothetical protein n=1 Tax=Phocaeicola sp. TaxID=2773926 RepID=UPI003A94AB18
IQPSMTSISNGIPNKEPPRAEPHAWWCERSENESRKKTTSFSSYSIYNYPVLLYKNSEKRRSWKVLQIIFNIKKYKISFRDTTNIYYTSAFHLKRLYVLGKTHLRLKENALAF